MLVLDDTALPKKGSHSVGVAAQYASALGKTANCQTLVSLTLARGEVPVMAALRLFLPDSWINDQRRLERTGVPADYRMARTKPEIALAEIDRMISVGMVFAVCWRMPVTGSARRSVKVLRRASLPGRLASLVTSRCTPSTFSSFGRVPK